MPHVKREPIRAKFLSFLTLEERLAGLTLEQRLAGLTLEQRLAGLTPEERLAALTSVPLLAGLAPEEQILALSNEVLRGFPDEYIRTLSEHAQQTIRKRLGR